MVERQSRHPRELVSSRIDGEIEPSEARFLLAHVAGCAACQQKEWELRAVAEGLPRLQVPDPPAEAVDRLLTRLAGEAANGWLWPAAADGVETGASGAWRWLDGVQLVVVAVAAACVFGIVYLGTSPERPGASAAESPVAPSSASIAAGGVADGASPIRGSGASDAGERVSGVAARKEPVPVHGALTARTAPAPVGKLPPAVAVAAQLVPSPEPSRAASAPALPSPALPEAASVIPRERAPVPGFPPVHFTKKKTDRLSEEAQELLASVADYLRENPDAELLVEGHANARRSADKNRALAARRAEAVARHLESLGTSPARLRIASFADERRRPSRGQDDELEDRNNRVEFVVVRGD